MGAASKIEWTQATWNPVTGCTKLSPGCLNCYAERIALRLRAMGQRNYARGFQVTTHEHMLPLPFRWRRPQMVFVNSMSDLFHDQVPTSFVQRVFEVMDRANWHVYQILTKRSVRLRQLSPLLPWPSHVWMGVSVETSAFYDRIEDLVQTPAAVKFLSLEPLLGPLPNLPLSGIDWVIVGGESGPRARPLREEWVLEIRDQCLNAGIPFFFKQWGGVNRKRSGRLLQGRLWNQMPEFAGR